jgi:Cu(I)/Ag(I) efflux system membrane fusion protein
MATTAQAEMKCEAGKCTSGKDTATKKLPAKPAPEASKNMPGMTAEEHAAMQLNENKTAKSTETPEQTKAKQNRRVIEQLFNVRTVRVERISAAKEQVNHGYIVAEDARRVDVVAWYSGFVETLYANTRYMKIAKGEPLAKIYSPEVYKAKQDYLNSIKFNAKRPSPGMLRGAREKLRLLNVNEKEIAAIERDRKIDIYTTLYAPVSGWLFAKKLNEGSSFKKQETLFEIVNLQEVWLEAKLYQKELAGLDALKHFSVTTEGYPTRFKARRSLLYPELNPKEATATLRLVVENPDEILKPGMYAKMHASATAQTRLVIPRTAAIRKEGRWYAFLATAFKGEYEPVPIEIEPLDNRYFIIKKGLREGEEVVNNALFMMDSDAQINSIY